VYGKGEMTASREEKTDAGPREIDRELDFLAQYMCMIGEDLDTLLERLTPLLNKEMKVVESVEEQLPCCTCTLGGYLRELSMNEQINSKKIRYILRTLEL
jgi:hypothetical protein